MNDEHDEIQKRHREIAEIERRLSEARESLSISAWARQNGIEVESIVAAARKRSSAADFEAAQRQAEEEVGQLMRSLSQKSGADLHADQPGAASRRVSRPMV